MRWDIATTATCHIIAFSGVNLSGQRTHVRIFPSGRVGDLEGTQVQSLIVVGPVGLRVVLMTASSDQGWPDMTWRAVEIRKGKHYLSPKGSPAVNLPDLDLYEDYDAPRTDPDFQQSFQLVRSLDEGKDWTYGFKGNLKLKNNVRGIRIEMKPDPTRAAPAKAEPAAEEAAEGAAEEAAPPEAAPPEAKPKARAKKAPKAG